jgi:vancomycin resistance protein VanW
MSLVAEGRFGRGWRRTRVALLGARRRLAWLRDPGFAAPVLAARPARRAWGRRIELAMAGGDPRLEAGKLVNVALAAAAFDGVLVSPARPLSFWRALEPATEARGFRRGIEVRGGCVVPAVGGGLCAISNALFTMAAELGWRVLERHGHSVALADPRALDATVAWPHVDLRIAPRRGRAVLAVRQDGEALTIEAWTDDTDGARAEVELIVEEAGDAGGRRRLRVRRRVREGGAIVEDRLIVDDDKELLAAVAHGALRTCLSCGEVACPTGRVERARLARGEDVRGAGEDGRGGSGRRLAVLR